VVHAAILGPDRQAKCFLTADEELRGIQAGVDYGCVSSFSWVLKSVLYSQFLVAVNQYHSVQQVTLNKTIEYRTGQGEGKSGGVDDRSQGPIGLKCLE
jgi:hypothetical protein